jgi:rubredoxin
MRFDTVADIIAFAIRREIEAAEGYARIGAVAKTPGLRELADELRRQEESHRRLLEELPAGTLRELGTAFVPDFHVVDNLPDEKLTGDMSIQDMLIFAAKKEAVALANRWPGWTGPGDEHLPVLAARAEHKPARPNTSGKSGKLERRTLDKYECTACGYVYDPAAGDPDNGIPPGTSFEALPDTWVCPQCGVPRTREDRLASGGTFRP